MKFKYCILFSVILIVLFSLTAISASEDVDFDCIAEDCSADDCFTEDCSADDFSTENIDQVMENQENVQVSDEDCDLSVNISVEKAYDGNKYNHAGSEIPWTVTVGVNGEMARNTKVYLNFSNNMEYVSSEKTIGEYDSNSGIWNIGDLAGSQSAVLTIVTRLNADGKFFCTANATTESIDTNLSNNVFTMPTKSGTDKNGSNVTQSSADRTGAQHTQHSQSDSEGKYHIHREVSTGNEEGSRGSNGNSSDDSSNGNSSKYESNGRNRFNSYSGVSKESKALNPLIADSASSILDGDHSKSQEGISKHISTIVPPYDYTRIPILICGLFFVALAAIVGYDKLKS